MSAPQGLEAPAPQALVAAYLPALVEVCLPALAGGARLVQGLTTINGIDQIQTANEASY